MFVERELRFAGYVRTRKRLSIEKANLLMMHRHEIQAPKLAINIRDELANLPLELGRVGQGGRRNLDEHDVPDPLGVRLEELVEGLELHEKKGRIRMSNCEMKRGWREERRGRGHCGARPPKALMAGGDKGFAAALTNSHTSRSRKPHNNVSLRPLVE